MNKTLIGVSFAAILALPALAQGATKTLAVPTHFQEQSQWCWNASSNSVLRFYDKHFVDQCEFADDARRLNSAYFGATQCCLDGNANLGADAVGCNRPNYLDAATAGSAGATLALYSVGTVNSFASLTYAQSKTEIDANHPFIMGWFWTGGGGHALTVKGYADAGGGAVDRLNVVNPAFDVGAQLIDYTAVVGCATTCDHIWGQTLKTTAPPAADDKVTLYANASYAGTATNVTANTADLAANSNTTTSAKVRGVPFILFDATNYGTPAWSVTPRDYASYTAWGETTDNQVSSVLKMPSATERIAVVVYSGQNFTGSSTTLTADSPTLPAGWDNAISSLIVVGKVWQLYANTNYGGNPYAVTSYGGPNRDGFYPTPTAWGGPDNDASSAKYLDATATPLANPIVLFANTDMTGRAVVLYSGSSASNRNDLSTLGFDNTVSSIRTYGGTWTVYANTNQGGTANVLAPNHWYRTAAAFGGTDNTMSSVAYSLGAGDTWTGQ